MKFLYLFALAFFFQSSFAQDDSSDQKSRTVGFEINYLSNSVYQGRKDSMTVSYFTPGIYYNAPSGFRASVNASFLAQEKTFDLFTLEAGYDFSIGRLDGGLSATRFFYDLQSVNVTSELNTTLSASLGYNLPFVRPSLTGSVSLGNKPDYEATFGLGHSFATENNSFSFSPAFYINGSTQNYYEAYYSQRRYNKKGRTNGATSVTAQTPDASKFKLMDYELAASAEYKANAFTFYAEPTYAVPQNPSTLMINTKTGRGADALRTYTEKLENSFYCTLGIRYEIR